MFDSAPSSLFGTAKSFEWHAWKIRGTKYNFIEEAASGTRRKIEV